MQTCRRFFTVICLIFATAATLHAAPPKEERTIVEAGLGAFYSPDGKWLAYKPSLLKFGFVSTAPKAKPTFEGDFGYAAFMPDSKNIVVLDTNRKVQVISVATGKSSRTLAIPFKNDNDSGQSIAISNDGKKIALTSVLNTALIMDAEKGAKVADLEKCIAHRLEFTKDDAAVVGYDGDGSICTWEVSSGKKTNSWHVGERDIVQCAFSSDGKLAAAAEADTGVVHLWDMAQAKDLGQLKNFKFINAIAISPDGKTVAVGCIQPKEKAQVKLWEMSTQKELDGIKDLPTRVQGLSFAPDGKSLVVCTEASFDSTTKAAVRLFSMP